MKKDPSTYNKINGQYDEWTDIRANQPAPPRVASSGPYKPEPEEISEMSRMLYAAIGIGIGLVLLALAATAFYAASTWAAIDRDGAALGYNLTGFFLTIAGLGGILATYHHNFRVLTRPPSRHH